MKKQKALVSACLLGERVRYDGAIKENVDVIEALREYDIIAFCPEAPLFGTPRQRISLHVKDDSLHVITDESNEDVTQALQTETKKYIEMYPELALIVLKSKSPSCGIKTTVIKNSSILGSGISALLFKEAYPNIKIIDETEIKALL